LSQRQLAMRMQVPRTYISKIENEKAMPTLSSMDRLARALSVTIPDLLRGGELTARERIREINADPFLSQLLPDLMKLDAMQRGTLLGEIKTMALRSRRSA
jgi:transcriptional regulator with XRE-family HTH domain